MTLKRDADDVREEIRKHSQSDTFIPGARAGIASRYDTRRNLTASLIDVPSRRCRGEGERTMFAVTTGMRRRCVTVRYDRCTRMCGVVNRRLEHATDRWGTYVYSLMMIFAFSKEALLEYSCFTKICSNANKSSTSSGCRMPGTGESFSFGGRRH